MIVFDLECLNGHTFEGWFDDRQDLETQQEQGILRCPVCETTSVVQILSPVAIKKSSSSPNPTTQNALQASQEVMAELTEKVVDYVEKNFEDVGSDFAKEALKMHYGSEEFRNIKGTTTKEEDKVLDKEGVPVFKLPTTKKTSDDLN
ncbi:MAG: DUF1178 family protein [Desulfobacteraceae bacterium]|nr:DUF1178 family protein [Desulfobacteraceae bacterium]